MRSVSVDNHLFNEEARKLSLEATWVHLARAQVQRRRALGVLAVLAIAVLPWVSSAWPQSGWVNEGLEWVGLALLVLAVFGIGLQTGSLVVGLILAISASLIFYWIVGEEEVLLSQAFGDSYASYCRQTPKFFPKWSLWRSPQHVTVDLHGVWKTVRDALPYFLSIPVFEAIEAAQQAGWLHVYFFLF